MCTSIRQRLGAVTLGAVLATLSVGCSSGLGGRDGEGSYDARLYSVASSPCDDPLEARQGGCGCIVLETHEVVEPALTPPVEPPTEEGRARRDGVSRIQPPRPPRKPAEPPVDPTSSVAAGGK